MNRDAGERFLAWLKQSIADDVIAINKARAPVQVLPEGLALVSPAVFRNFDTAHWSHVQKRFQKLKLHIKTPGNTNIWTCYTSGTRKQAILKVLLIPDASNVLGVELPAPKSNLRLSSPEDATPCV